MIKIKLKQTILLLLLSAVICGNFISCRKACFTKKLGELNCEPGYISVSDAEYKGKRNSGWKYDRDQLVVINDIDSYKQAFAYGDSMPLGYIDFTTKSLVGVVIYIDMGDELDHQGCFCYNPDSKQWQLKIEYSLSHQCWGSKIYSGQLMCTIICPKLPDNANVTFTEKNINPL